VEVRDKVFYPQLEALRGVAALSVVLLHILLLATNGGRSTLGSEALSQLGWSEFIAAQCGVVIFNGRAAVTLFFVLSGFVLSIGFDQSKTLDFQAYIRFLIRRAFRLLPALWVAVMLSVMVGSFWAGQEYSVGSIAKYFLLLDLSFDPPAWTLVLEIGMCVIYPFILFSFGRFGLGTKVMALFGLAWLSTRAPIPIHYGQVQGALPVLAFALGLSVPTIGYELIRGLGRGRNYVATFAFAALFVPELLRWYADFHSADNLPRLLSHAEFVVQFGCFYLVSWLIYARPSLLTKLLHNKSCLAIGRWSYSIYVLHGPVLWAGTSLIYLSDEPMLRLALGILTVVPVTIAISALNYSAVERPLANWGKVLAGRLLIGHASANTAAVQPQNLPAGSTIVPAAL
jgi:peptidoglycan/LPS O-acetylase OafA/YrhL